jgi:hypothetical protein
MLRLDTKFHASENFGAQRSKTPKTERRGREGYAEGIPKREMQRKIFIRFYSSGIFVFF